jgi:hypothetical protein
MMPISEIHEGDQFENVLLRPNGLTYIVTKINKDEKMVQVQAVDSKAKSVGKPLWKSNHDRMFSEGWKVFDMYEFTRKHCTAELEGK